MPESQEPKKVINNDLPNSQFGGGLINAETVNAGRIGGDIWNIVNIVFGRQKAADILAKNRQLLLAQVKQEVASRLEQSLHNAVLINLGKESQPQQVKRLWDAEVKIGLKPPEPIPDTTRIIDVFDSVDVAGKLLILGAPGSGKTTTQLELAQELIKRAEEQPDYPVPVLFNLSSWKDDRQPLSDWLVAELKSKYGVSIKFGKEWVDNKQLLPLLDGLDELEPQRQEYCVRAINQFLAGENRPLSLVVCSRSEEYSNYSTQLQLNGAIYLQHLSNRQICDYLTSINSIELWSTISSDLDLLELVKTPLLLSITVLAFQEISVEEWQNLNSTADQIQYLLDAYVGRMLTRDINSRADLKKKTPDARRTRMWLVWLAQQLQRESKTEFLIEEMQPSLLKTKISKIIYNLIVSVIIHGLIFWFFYDLLGFSGILDFYRNFYDDKNLIFSEINALNVLITGMFMGLILVLGRELNFGLIIKQLEDKIKNHALINPQSLFNKRIIRWLIIRLNFGLTFTQIEDKIKNHALINSQSLFNEEIIIALIEGLNFGFWGLIFGLSWGLTGGLIFGLISVLIEGLKFGLFGLILGLIVGIIWGLIVGIILGLTLGLTGGLIWGLSFGIWGLSFRILGRTNRFIFELIGDKIQAVETLNFSIHKIKIFNELIRWLILGLTLGLTGGLSLELSLGVYGLIFGLINGLISGLISGFYVLKIEKKTIPNEGIWQSVKNTAILFLLTFLPSTILIFFINLIIFNNSSLNEALILSLVSGLFAGLLMGIISGTPVIKHFTLRLILFRNGYIPWNYARFLDYCTDRLFLQRVGGRYRFIHKLLQDHFAQREFRKP